MTVYPSYYHKFSCIASRCRHSCCIGWEIDVDEDAYERYQCIRGELGERLRNAIADDETLHFILDEGERCPFLNRENLCDLILSLGEDSLCEICREHPRFYSFLSDRTEVGLGLCCEEAARLILSEKEPVYLLYEGKAGQPDAWEKARLSHRDRVFAILQNRKESMNMRMERLLDASRTTLPHMREVIRLLLTLEIMTPEWKGLLSDFLSGDDPDLVAFSCYMQPRESEYEQFSVCLAYRYLVTAYDNEDLRQKTAFIVWAYRLLQALGAYLWQKNGVLTEGDQIELVRLFSAELEYDEDNLLKILTLL